MRAPNNSSQIINSSSSFREGEGAELCERCAEAHAEAETETQAEAETEEAVAEAEAEAESSTELEQWRSVNIGVSAFAAACGAADRVGTSTRASARDRDGAPCERE